MLAVFVAVSLAPAPRVLPARTAAPPSRYDLLLASPGKLPHWQLPVTPQLAAYRSAMLSVMTQEAPAVEAAQALLAEMGENTERMTATAAWGEVFDGLEIKADKEGGALNKLSHGVKERLGASMTLLPRRAAKLGGASFNAHERRISSPDIDSPEFYAGLLHESRHAWYSKEEREGRIRLFHVKALARPGRVLVPGILSYENFISFEELSTFPKTLRHLAALENKELALRRYWYTLDTFRTAAALIEEAVLRKGQLQDVGDGLALGMRHAEVYVPYTSKPEEDMALRWKLIYGMISGSLDPLRAYKAAVDAEDWKAAKAASSKLVAQAAKAEKAWLER